MSAVLVHQVVSDAAARWPDRTAVVDGLGPLTFVGLHQAVDALAAELVAAGVRQGHGVALVAANGRGFVIGLFAGLAAGATVMPVSPRLAPPEARSMCEDAGVHFVLDDRSAPGLCDAPSRSATLAGVSFGIRAMDQAPAAGFATLVPEPAFVRYTSGTTGRAKGVVISHGSVLARTEAAREALDIGPDDVVVWVLPMAYHFIVSVVMYVRYGATIAVCAELLARHILASAARHGGTLLYAAPTHYRMLAADTSDARLDSLRLAVSTSSGIPRDVALAFHTRYNLPIAQVYGIIEIGIPVGNLERGEDHPDAIGRALPGYEVAIVDDDGQEVSPGVVGQLGLRGDGMFDAYLDPPTLRSEVLEHGWFLTGDLARVADNGLIVIAGRRKSMINTAGLKVFPEEVEAVLDAHPGVSGSRVLGAPHPVMGEVVTAEVVAVGDPPDVEVLRRWCRQRLSAFKVPQRIRFVVDLPRTGSGKVARAAVDIPKPL